MTPSLSTARDTCLSVFPGLLGRRLLGPGEEEVDLAAGLAQNRPRLRDVGSVTCAADLPGGREQLEGLIAQVAMVAADRSRSLVPRRRSGGEAGRFLAPGVGQLEDPASTLGLDGTNESL